jgi:hypothetical protein
LDHCRYYYCSRHSGPYAPIINDLIADFARILVVEPMQPISTGEYRHQLVMIHHSVAVFVAAQAQSSAKTSISTARSDILCNRQGAAERTRRENAPAGRNTESPGAPSILQPLCQHHLPLQ